LQGDNSRKFEDCFRMALADSERLVHDIEMRQFREGCVGLAADLFTAFYAVATEKAETVYRDIPWKLLHQLAWHLNNVSKKYNEAYGILKTILSLTTLSPTTALTVELESSMGFFKRNHYWNRIDSAAVSGDHGTMILYIDRLMPIVTAGHEKSNLIMLRAKAVKSGKGLPCGCLWLLIAVLLILFGINYILNKFAFTDPGENASTTITSLQPTNGDPIERIYATPELASMSLKVFNRAGLNEIKPPLLPHGRKLNLSELRYVIFQKRRLEYLGEIELSPQEKEILRQLWEEWRSRGENIDFETDDRKKVENEANLYSAMLKSDAEDQLERSLKVFTKDGWKKDPDNGDIDESPLEMRDNEHKPGEQPSGEVLLNLRVSADIQKVLLRLEQIGYYNGPTDLDKWNRVARAALARFKAAKMLRIDDQWDLETQQALFADK
ncbi:MAG: hypothetical protein KKB51_21245, partial [Candidatus Riflebacteria bacterium]|nr:hypothetical protein [Candidatus Riflebacteria bacterium]